MPTKKNRECIRRQLSAGRYQDRRSIHPTEAAGGERYTWAFNDGSLAVRLQAAANPCTAALYPRSSNLSTASRLNCHSDLFSIREVNRASARLPTINSRYAEFLRQSGFDRPRFNSLALLIGSQRVFLDSQVISTVE